MVKSTFRDIVTSRTVIASAEIDEEQFRKIIGKINKRFGLRIEDSQETYELFRDHIRFVAGRFWEGKRDEDPYATPFTVLVFEAERVLPEAAWSPNLATCAKRIETSLKRLKRPVRKKSIKTG